MGTDRRMDEIGWVIIAALSLLGGVYAGEGSPSGTTREKGLLGYWRFDEGRGEEATDSSGRGNDGEIYGAEWVGGRFGSALYFGGRDAYVSLPEIEGLDGSNEMTVEVWAYWEGGGRYPNLLTGGTWNPGGFLIFVADNGCSFRLGKPGDAPWTGKDWEEVGAPFLQFSLGQWYHLAATFRRPVVQTYVNGEPVGSARWDYPIGHSGEVQLGTWGNPAVCHQGLLDEVMIYNRALSPEEVRASFNKEAPRRLQPLSAGEKPYEKIMTPGERPQPAVTLENSQVKLLLDAKARVVGILDRRTGKDYAAKPYPPVALLRKGGRDYRPTGYVFQQGRLKVAFGKAGTAALEITPKKQYFVFRVLSVEGKDIEALTYLNVRVKPDRHVSAMSGQAADNEFAFCLRTLNLQSAVSVGGSPPLLRATCFSQHGLEGAGALLATSPPAQLRGLLRQALQAEGVFTTPWGGPAALDAPENRYSYLFSTPGEKDVEEWIALAKRAGTPIIHLVGWEQSLGHYEPRRDLYPNGLAGLKQVADKIHAAGLKIGIHTLTGCIAPNDPFITPVPDKRLAKDQVFTLAADLDATATEVRLEESPQGLDTVWAYASRGNVVQVEDELIQFTGYTDQPPYKLTGCRRGAFGTKVAPHTKGGKVFHLYAYYGCFYPDENSTLVEEIADCIARVVNECHIDFIYEDGSEGMPGGWYGVSRMRAAIVKRFDHPVRVEASEWGYHSWPFHSCIGAWDHPCWGLKPFVDAHCRESELYRQNHLLPGHLGWWVILGPSHDYDGEFPEEIEYLCCKSIGYNLSMSFQGVSLGARPWNARQDEYLTKIGQYERLRLAGYFSEAIREKLKTPKEEYRLSQASDGEWQLTPTDYWTHKVTGLSDGSNRWTLRNRYDSQPVKLRIQALYGVAPYDSPDAVTLVDFSKPEEFTTGAAADVVATFRRSTEEIKVGPASGCFEATSRATDRRGAWAKAATAFPQEISLGQGAALGVWIHGDGKGEVLNLQLADSPVFYHGSHDEHYVDVHFTGWRYFELPLRERDAERYGDYTWPYGNIYSVYRTPLMRDHIQGLNLYYNYLPSGDPVKCYLSPIKVLPVVKVKLQNPSVTIGGKRIVFPVALESGQYLEFESPNDCRLYDERGELLRRIAPQGDVPIVGAGDHEVAFDCIAPEGYNARARITVITQGKPRRGMAPKEKIDWKWLKTEYDMPRIIQALDGKQNEWDLVVRKDARDARMQVEILVDRVGSAGAGYESKDALTLESFDDLSRFSDAPENRFAQYVWDSKHKGIADKPGVTHKLESSPEVVKVGPYSLRFTATSQRNDDIGWCAQGERFSPALDLSPYRALGFWLHGDGNGESFKVQLRDVQGGWQDLVTPVNFTGWRYVEFELGAEAKIDLSKIEYLILYYNGLPAGKTVTCYVDDLRALGKPGAIRHPTLALAGRKVLFPVSLSPGERLVYKGSRDGLVYGREGTLKQSIKPIGELPRLKPGRNRIVFGLDAGSPGDFQVRVLTTKVYR